MLATLGKLRTSNYVGFIVLVITIGATKEIFRFVSRGKFGPNLDIYNGETSGFEVDGSALRLLL
jgi:hypothetical protein